MLSPQDINITPVTKKDNESLSKKLNDFITRMSECYRYLRADTVKVEDKVDAGVTGWFDDGANFRITVTNGIITAIGDSTGAGHS